MNAIPLLGAHSAGAQTNPAGSEAGSARASYDTSAPPRADDGSRFDPSPASLSGVVPRGGRPTLSRAPGCRTWPGIVRAGSCEIAIDGYFVLDGKLHLGRSEDERAEIGAAMAHDLPRFLARVENGFFNAVIHDAERKETRFVSDRFGALPLYLAPRAQGLFFASTYAGLKALLPEALAPDPVGIAELYWFGYPLGDRTSYRGVEHMPAATVLTVRGDGSETRWTYPTPLPAPVLPATSVEMAEQLVGIMSAAAKRLHRSDASFGAKISAGMDSRLVCGAWPDHKVRAYTHGFPGSAEMTLARKLAAALGMAHTSVPVTGDFFTALHAPVFDAYGVTEFFHQASLPAMRKDGVELVLDGLGGDVLLGGLTLKRNTSPVRQALGLTPPEAPMPQTDEGIADYILSRIRVGDGDYRPLTPEAASALGTSWNAIRGDMTAEVRKARVHTQTFAQLYTEVVFRNRTRRLISLQGTACRPQVETLYPFLDREFLSLLGHIPAEWVANKRLYLEMYSHCLPAIRSTPGMFSLLPFTVPLPAHYAGRIVRYGLERTGLQISQATRGRLHPWPADGIQWRRWLAFNREFVEGARAFLRPSRAFDEKAFDAALPGDGKRTNVSGTRFMQTVSYCGYFR